MSGTGLTPATAGSGSGGGGGAGQSSSTSTSYAGGPAAGVQILLDAEKEANRLVQQARQYRIDRLKEARAEAASEVLALKSAKNAEYLSHEKSLLASLDSDLAAMSVETEKELACMRVSAGLAIPDAAQLLVDTVLKVHPKVHSNFVPQSHVR